MLILIETFVLLRISDTFRSNLIEIEETRTYRKSCVQNTCLICNHEIKHCQILSFLLAHFLRRIFVKFLLTTEKFIQAPDQPKWKRSIEKFPTFWLLQRVGGSGWYWVKIKELLIDLGMGKDNICLWKHFFDTCFFLSRLDYSYYIESSHSFPSYFLTCRNTTYLSFPRGKHVRLLFDWVSYTKARLVL